MNQKFLNACVFCASSPRVDESYIALARDMGSLVAKQGWRLIYGGGRNGLMGAVADAALDGGAEVEGVIPHNLQEKEVGHSGLTKLHITDTMHQRQMKMAELGDGFVILPGGLGTLAEFFEIVTWHQLELHQKPIALINYEGYWQPLIDMIEKSAQENFLHGRWQEAFNVLDNLEDLPDFFASNVGHSTIKSDLL